MQTFSDLSPQGYNSPTSFVWLEWPLHKVFKPKVPPKRSPFLAKNFSIISTLHLSLAHVSSPISETIHVNPLITTIKKNKIVSLLFNVRLNIFTNSHLPYSLPYLYIYVITFIHFNYLILKCSNNPPLILILKFLIEERLPG